MVYKRIPLIAGNWKMYKTPAEAGTTAKQLREQVVAGIPAEIVICPPFTAIAAVALKLAGSEIAWGAQNMFWAPEGAYTGEISGPMLQSMGCRYVILGHSERRGYFGETDDLIKYKIESALTLGLRPIFCLGEGLETRESGQAVSFCSKQLDAALDGLKIPNPADFVIAYEPIWAIGTGKAATATDAVEMISALRKEMGKLYSPDFADQVRILYGGSVKAESIKEFIKEEQIDGVLVGGASLKVDSFIGIINGTAEVRGQKA